MTRRKRASGGQAIVMVTLALFSMVGMMGLAVDLGWSYFAQKQAQAAADTAALAAAQEAVSRLGTSSNVSGFSCGSTGTTAGTVECTEQPGGTVLEYCGSVTATSNLNNGCLYAKRNGFQYDVGGSRQIVSVQSGDVTDVNAPPNVKRMSYWVRVRTIQSIPQLFSYNLGAGITQGTVAANATAAIAGAITPGSFFGMNHAGDCWSLPGSPKVNCGMDLDNQATGSAGACPGGGTASICAPAGVILSSNCNAITAGCSQAWAGNAANHSGVETSTLLVSSGGATPGDWHNSSGVAVSPTPSSSAANFVDKTAPNAQPPLQATNPIPSCGIQGGNLNGGILGPFQYYAYSALSPVNNKPIPTGARINVSGTATFSSSGTCPGVLSGGAPQSGSFPSYVFYGGVNVQGTMKLTGGQYVMAGVNSNAAGQNVLDTPSSGGTIQAADATATGTGTMFIFTDGSYPGLGGPKSQGNTGTGTGQITALPNWDQMPALYQGSINIKNSNITMDGLVNSTVAGSTLPASMNPYTGIVWWQDRRNSMVEYNQCTSGSVCTNPTLAPNCGALCTKDDGTVVACGDQSAGQCTASQTLPEIVNDNHVTSTSPGVALDPGTGSIKVNGVYYQPRGAWVQIIHGNAFGAGTLQFLTGSLQLTTGTDKLLLAGPTNPLITYKAVLIQ